LRKYVSTKKLLHELSNGCKLIQVLFFAKPNANIFKQLQEATRVGMTENKTQQLLSEQDVL
jgi:hypothetical protein